ncbi:hypothetical protein CRUP_000904 [Coryphaenoides rupestris]|nr:hypothetical protein CRUP_000904 [Coryphaenoides rupestris]
MSSRETSSAVMAIRRPLTTRRQRKNTITSTRKRGPLVAEEGTFSVPFSARHEVVVLRQHSWRQVVVELVHQVWLEQLFRTKTMGGGGGVSFPPGVIVGIIMVKVALRQSVVLQQTLEQLSIGIMDAPQVELGDIQGVLVGIALELALEEVALCCVVLMLMGVGVTPVVVVTMGGVGGSFPPGVIVGIIMVKVALRQSVVLQQALEQLFRTKTMGGVGGSFPPGVIVGIIMVKVALRQSVVLQQALEQPLTTRRQRKNTITSTRKRGPLVAEEGTFSVPFSARHEVVVLRQHSWRQVVVELVHQVWLEQLSIGIMDAPQVELGDIQGVLVGIALELALEEVALCCVVLMLMGVGVTPVVVTATITPLSHAKNVEFLGKTQE